MPNTNPHHATVNHNSPHKQNPKLLSIFLKFIIMFLILSLFLIFIGVAAILLLNLFLAGTVVNRRRRQPTTDLQHHLPTFQYSASTTSDDCSICLECFKEGEVCRVVPVCEHLFHAQCVDLWLMEVLNCPVCRTPVRMEIGRPCGSIVSDDDSKFMWPVEVGRQVV